MGNRTDKAGSRSLSFLPIPVLIIGMTVIHFAVRPTIFYEPAWLLPITNTIFVTAVGVVVAYVAMKNYLATGRIQVLLLGCGLLSFGLGGVVAGWVRSLPGGANLNVTIYNTAALLGGIFHFAAAFLLLAGVSPEAGTKRKRWWLFFSYIGGAAFTALFTQAALWGMIPPFFIQGVGPTTLRQTVLGSADVLFIFSFVIFMGWYLRRREAFLYWYSSALALTAISLTGFFIESAVGSPIGWLSRGSQYLGGIYFLIAIATAARTAQGRKASIDRALAAALSPSEESFLRTIFDNLSERLFACDQEGNVILVNDAARNLYGIEEPVPWPVSRLTAVIEIFQLDGRQLPPSEWPVARVLRGEQLSSIELRVRTKATGKESILSYSGAPVRDRNGAVVMAVLTSEDITERRQTEEALRRAGEERQAAEIVHAERQRLLEVLETLPAMICLLTPDYHVAFANRSFREKFGESHGQHCYEYCFGLSKPCDFCQSFNVLKTGHPHHWEVVSPDSTVIDVHDFPFTDVDGSPLILEMDLDITKRRRAEEALRQANAYNRSLLEASLDPLVTIGPDGKITDVNAAAEAARGCPRAELIGTDFSDYFAEPEKARAGYLQAFQEGFVRDYPLELLHRDGHLTPVLYNATVYRDAGGKTVGVFAAARDISERRRTEAELARHRQHLEELVKERTIQLETANAQLRAEVAERKRSEAQLHKLNRTLTAYSHSIQALLHAESEPALLDQVCRIVINDCGYAMAWIGFAENDSDKTVRPVAHAGLDAGYLDFAGISWGDNERGSGPTGMAIRTGEPSVCRDMLTDPKFEPWRKNALQRGFASSLVLPLTLPVGHLAAAAAPGPELAGGKVFGALTIYSKKLDPFSADEVTLLSDLAEDLAYGIGTLRISAAHEQAGEALRLSEEKFAKAFTGNPAAISLTRLEDGLFLDVNDTWVMMIGYRREEVIGHYSRKMNLWPTPEAAARFVEELREKGSLHGWEQEFRKKSGELFVAELSAQILVIGGVNWVLSTFIDITARKRAEEEISQRNAVLSGMNTIFEEALRCESDEELGQTCLRVAEQLTGSKFGFIGEIGADGLLHDLAVSDLGWELCAMYDKSGHRRPPGNFKIQSVYGRVLKDGKSVLTNDPARHPDSTGLPAGHPALTAFLGVPLIDKGRTIGMIAVANREGGYREQHAQSLEALAPAIIQALHRTRAERALRSNEARLRLALNAAKSGTWEWDLRTNMNKWSYEIWSLYGMKPYSCEPSYANWLATIHPEDRETARRKIQEAAAGSAELNIEYRVPGASDQVRWLAIRGRPLFDSKGEAASYIGIAMDITDRKQAEQALIRSEKLASVGRMAAAMAHEINNPLEAVTNTLYIAKQTKGLPEAARLYLETADAELKRVAHITRQSLGFYRESNSPTLTSIPAVMDSAIDLLRSKTRVKHAVIRRQWHGDLQVTAVASELRQVFSNLLANSLDAIDERGGITLRVSPAVDARGRHCVRVTIADNGRGISTSSRPHVFEPFFTTKGALGTGLGLWVSKQIIEKHGGSIRMRSSTGGARRGTVFSILLPVQPATARGHAAGA